MLTLLVLMGVSGCGKSTIGKDLTLALNSDFIEGDDYHPPENVQKMKQGIPLTDTDRYPWLIKLHSLVLEKANSYKNSEKNSPEQLKYIVMTCSALRIKYRQIIVGDNQISTTNVESDADQKENQFQTKFIYLELPKHELVRRLEARKSHFFNGSLLDTQLETLELPTEESKDLFKIDCYGKKNQEIVNEIMNIIRQ
ncbi:hypothetical protein BB558_000882 [Smittium angustum]|uniref:Gluconokinase n=1 Tax=Smittium angustum TaxID=133377 RepID=A0A2U1JD12_SMIAN|nr:hypothetical protein BB558_000882 [Smittium angustum]